MGKSNTSSQNLLKLIFQAVNFALIADNTATTPLTQLFVALHTADPGVGGSQTTNEIAYTGYARVAVNRTAAAWPLTGQSISPAATIGFPPGTGGSGTAMFFSIGTTAGAAGVILYSGAIMPNLVCGSGVTPQLSTATTISES
jgi:hypothetical protein